MYGNNSVQPLPQPRAPSSTSDARRPFRMAPIPWESSPVAYVARGNCNNMGGYSHSASSPYSLANARGGDAGRTWHAAPPAVAEERRLVYPEAAIEYKYPSQTVYSHSSFTYRPPAASVPYEEAVRIAWAQQYPVGRGYDRQPFCQVEGCRASPSYSVDGKRPAVLCSRHREKDMHPVRHHDSDDDRSTGRDGCEPEEKVNDMSHGGKIDRFCSERRTPDVVAAKTAHCEHLGCIRAPKYGHKDGPLSLCQSHKRVGMYTNRNGKLLIATREGSAFRPAIPPAATATSHEHTAWEPSRRSRQASEHLEHFVSLPLQAVKAPGAVLSRLTTLYRKLCEVPGCQIQPSYGPHGTSRPRFCAGHKKKGMVGLKNRPCLFPGCVVRPHYGLSGGRPVYCASHKKSSMVHLLKESMTREKEATARKNSEGQDDSAETNPAELPKGAKMQGVKAAEKEEANTTERAIGLHEDDERHVNKRGEVGKSSRRRIAGPDYGKKDVRGEVTTAAALSRRGSPASHRLRSASSPVIEQETSTTSEMAKPYAALPTTTQTANFQQPPRRADTWGMPPSAEMGLLHKANESSRLEGETNGSGRRARAPSRKFLEAAGLDANEGAQWMTKEIKEAEAERLRNLRKKRKQYKAAGLRSGEVLETCSVPVTNVRSKKKSSKNATVGSGRTESVGGQGILLDKNSWPKVSPAEPLRQDARHRRTMVDRSTQYFTGGSAIAPSEVGGVAASEKSEYQVNQKVKVAVKKRKGATLDANNGTHTMSAANDNTKSDSDNAKKLKKCRQTKYREDGEEGVGHCPKSAKKGGGKQKASGRADRDGQDGSAGEGETVCTTTCEYHSCSKTATFGVNGTVRYCKKHRLFGMHEIVEER